jgi:hypothetical protein
MHPIIYPVSSVSITPQLGPVLRAPFTRFGSDAGGVGLQYSQSMTLSALFEVPQFRAQAALRVARLKFSRYDNSELIVTCGHMC